MIRIGHQVSGARRVPGEAYRGGMTSTALTVASIAALVAALVVALRALWNMRDRK